MKLVLMIFLFFILIPSSDQCGIGFYDNGGTCLACNYACYQCDVNGCTNCLNSNNRGLVGATCAPLDGYYETNTAVAALCPGLNCKKCDPSNINTCTKCFDGYYEVSGNCQQCNFPCLTCDGGSSGDCLTCVSEYYVNSQQCFQCSSAILNCLECLSNTRCTKCSDGYYIKQMQCQKCELPCTLCQSESYCSGCEQYYEVQNKKCIEICGDSYVIDLECDFTIGIEYDGCTDSCLVQQNFTCFKENHISSCYYTEGLLLNFIKYTDYENQNKITVDFIISPKLHTLSDTDLTQYLSLQDSKLKIGDISYNVENGQISMNIQYFDNIPASNITLRLNNKYGTNQALQYITETSIAFEIEPQKYYEAWHYQFFQFCKTVSIIITVLAWVSFLVGVPTRKLVGLQIMMVVQFAWTLFVGFPNQIQKAVANLFPLKYSNGYNIPLNVGISETEPLYAAVFQLSQRYFWSNFNISFIWYGLPFIISLCLAIANKFVKVPSKKETAKKAYQISVELLMYLYGLNLIYFLDCSIIYFKYGDLNDVGSIICFIVALLFTLGAYIKFWHNPDPFGRFRYEFKVHKLGFKHYYLYSLLIVVCVLIVMLVPTFQWIASIPLFLFTIFLLIFQPYKNSLAENIRASFYLSLMNFGIFINLYVSFQDSVNLIASRTFLILIASYLSLILIGILWSYVVLIIYYIEWYNQPSKIQKQEQELNIIEEMIQMEANKTQRGILLSPTGHQAIFKMIEKGQAIESKKTKEVKSSKQKINRRQLKALSKKERPQNLSDERNKKPGYPQQISNQQQNDQQGDKIEAYKLASREKQFFKLREAFKLTNKYSQGNGDRSFMKIYNQIK